MVSPVPPIAPNAPKKSKVAKRFALDVVRCRLFATTAPPAPRKRCGKKTCTRGALRGIKKELFPPSPQVPQAPRKRPQPRRPQGEPISLKWESDEAREAQRLADTGEVRDCVLVHTPDTINDIFSQQVLHELLELYFPCSQPHTDEEEAYFHLLRYCVQKRISLLFPNM